MGTPRSPRLRGFSLVCLGRSARIHDSASRGADSAVFGSPWFPLRSGSRRTDRRSCRPALLSCSAVSNARAYLTPTAAESLPRTLPLRSHSGHPTTCYLDVASAHTQDNGWLKVFLLQNKEGNNLVINLPPTAVAAVVRAQGATSPASCPSHLPFPLDRPMLLGAATTFLAAGRLPYSRTSAAGRGPGNSTRCVRSPRWRAARGRTADRLMTSAADVLDTEFGADDLSLTR